MMGERWVQRLVPHMIVGLAGPRLSRDEIALLSRYRFPGVILFDRNVQDARQLIELAHEIRVLFREARGDVPLIAADHEGGIISVLGRAIGVPPTQMAAARTGDLRLCERLFAENARRLRACGVNVLLGPVADINSEFRNPVIGSRSFGEDRDLVSSLVSTAVSAAKKGGVLTCIKHFPGHGSTSLDSHLALPILGATLDELKRKDVLPFAGGLAAGAETVMVGHVAPLGRGLPASLDPEIIGGLLRGELGFEGVVMTDALEMEGAKAAGRSDARPLSEICRLALLAGNDILLFSKPVSDVVAELQSIGDSPVDEETWSRDLGGLAGPSMARIEKLLQAAAKGDRDFELPSDPGVYREIAERSVAVVRGSEARPLLGAAGEIPTLSAAERGLEAVFWCEKGHLDRYPAQSFVAQVLGRLPAQPGPVAEAMGLEGRRFSTGEAGSAPDVVFLMNRGPLSEQAVRELCSEARLVVVAGWPYAARYLPAGIPAIVTYGIYDAAADAVRRGILEK